MIEKRPANNIKFHLRKLEKEVQIKSIVSRRNKIRAEFN